MKAFPVVLQSGNKEYGMDLRDYFAGLAMQGLLAGQDSWNILGMADWSYQMADAMMQVRNGK